MEQFDAKVLDTIEQVADYFATQTVQKWVKNIQRQKLMNTKQLLNSLDQETKKDLGRLVVVMMFAFEDYGRQLDIKNKYWGDQPPVQRILNWVETKHLSSFGPDPRPYKNKVKTPERRRNEIAWGIARKIALSKRGPKRTPWFQSTLYKGLNAFYEELSMGVADRSVEEMKETLAWRLKRGSTIKVF